MTLEDLVKASRDHADMTASDLELASNREEHVRQTARANEAETLAQALYDLYISSLTV
jgi:hypothetical protein